MQISGHHYSKILTYNWLLREEVGDRGEERGLQGAMKKLCGADGYIRYLNCGDGFIGV